jgi:hypothetical protein
MGCGCYLKIVHLCHLQRSRGICFKTCRISIGRLEEDDRKNRTMLSQEILHNICLIAQKMIRDNSDLDCPDLKSK